MAYSISEILPSDARGCAEAECLLQGEGLCRDVNLDYTCGMYDESMKLIASGSCFKNTLRCFAVDPDHRGEGLLNEIMTHLLEVQAERGNFHVFVYTKTESVVFFESLGFHEIASVRGRLSFLENRRDGFSRYLSTLTPAGDESKKTAAIVMNANPFTLGHQYLVETAAKENDLVHLFLLSEEAGPISFAVRKRLVQEGTKHLPNVVLHESGPYIISSATFPAYFLRSSSAVIDGQARLDAEIFCKIASHLGITKRYLGEEPSSMVTASYNTILSEELPKNGIECRILPRKEADGRVISASTVRTLLKDGDFSALESLLPESSLRYFRSDEASPVLEAIRKCTDLIHY